MVGPYAQLKAQLNGYNHRRHNRDLANTLPRTHPMFDETTRVTKKLGETGLQVGIPMDSDGYLDRECPATECEFEFKVHGDDWRNIVTDELVHCPFCGHVADSGKWFTQDQLENLREGARAQLSALIGGALRKDAESWNRQQPRNSFIRMTLQVKDRPEHVLVPPEAADPMRLKITCSQCACRYAVVGAAYFCPACGHNSADQMFRQSMHGIGSVMDALPHIRAAITDKDVAETTARQAVEAGLQNAVTSFQRYAETLYAKFPAAPKARRNAFQNLADGSTLWHSVSGKNYADYLTAAQLSDLTRLFQQRHLLAHTDGIVDQDYITRSGDSSYAVGQRIIVRDNSVRELLSILLKLTECMSQGCP